MKKNAISYVVALAGALCFCSCQHVVDYYIPPVEEQPQPEEVEQGGFDYAASFENFSYYRAKITSSQPFGRFYSVYTEYPYDEEGAIKAMPILCGLTPFDVKMAVPKAVKALYVLSSSGVKQYPVGDLNITDETTRAEAVSKEELERVKTMVVETLLPEKAYNIRKTDLYQCTDLVIDKLEEDEVVKVWLSYLGNLGGISGKFWYYVYEKENPTIADCTFYGMVDGEQQVVSFEDDVKAKKNPFLTTNNAVNEEIELNVSLTEGQRMGFVYVGDKGFRFSTPSLNTAENTEVDYIGKTITYATGDRYKVTNNVTSGAIIHFSCDGKEYNVIGMDNSLPGESSYDGDYNDMLILARFNPERIKPAYELPPVDTSILTTRTGVWIFEDNYPETGDFDFNDVVIYYQVETNEDKGYMDVTCWLAAYGCSFKNEVGLKVLAGKEGDAWKNAPTQKETLWSGINGYFNVGTDINFSNLKFKKVRLNCTDYELLRPYLNNGKGECSLEHFNTSNYPYALDIPSSKGTDYNTWFRWPLEGHSLDDGYWFLKNEQGGPRNANWYLNGQIKDKNGDHVVPLTREDNEFFVHP